MGGSISSNLLYLSRESFENSLLPSQGRSKTFPQIEWGKNIRVILDVGCGVASFDGYLLDINVITMSFAPKDDHEAQIQFARERGIPATFSVIGTQKVAFSDNAYDMIHCARCRVNWDGDEGKPLMELNRMLRPGGFFVWSATPVYRDDERDKKVWKAMVALTEAICWKEVKKTFFDSAGDGLVIYQKSVSSSCYENWRENNPLLCDQNNRSNSSWTAKRHNPAKILEFDNCRFAFHRDAVASSPLLPPRRSGSPFWSLLNPLRGCHDCKGCIAIVTRVTDERYHNREAPDRNSGTRVPGMGELDFITHVEHENALDYSISVEIL
ncbi:putative methyltransferase PMT23 [Capsicum annuum]|nr:putative methyltransferase PMT23 [Capsicum annuum]